MRQNIGQTTKNGDFMVIEKKTIDLFRGIVKCLKPLEIMSISEWADTYRILSAEGSAESGKWHTDRTPYMRKIMDAASDPAVNRVIVMSSAQVGKSELINNAIGRTIHNDPCSILLVQPTDTAAKDFSKERIAPMLRDTPVLRNIVGKAKSRVSNNTITKKMFPGGYLAIVGANSPTGLASRSIKILLCDEIDRWPLSAAAEGDPLSLAQKRQTAYLNTSYLNICTSTPTIDGISRIQHEFMLGTQEEYELPCPKCGEYQQLSWDFIDYDEKDGVFDESKEVYHMCPHCGEGSTEAEWKAGANKGKWKEHSENKAIKSFHLSSLYSPWKSWAEIVKAYLSAKDDKEMLKAWTNTELGLPWVDDGETIEDAELNERRIYYNCAVPKDVLLITCGVDTQDDRFELEVVGWGRDERSYGIEYKVIYGDTSLPETWALLDLALKSVYTDENGKQMQILRTCIDSGGHRTKECYKFCADREKNGVFAIKGMGGMGLYPIKSHTKTKRVGNQLFIIGVDTIKTMLYSRLAQKSEDNAGYCFFPAEEGRGYNQNYFKGLTSEIKITEMRKGRPYIRWEKKKGHFRNEPLDCRVYAIAAFEILNPNMEVYERLKNGQSAKRRRKKGSKGIDING